MNDHADFTVGNKAPEPPIGRPPVIDQLNARYFVVNEAGKAVIYSPAHDPMPRRDYYERLTFGDFEKFYRNRTATITKPNGKKVTLPLAELWLSHPDRRQYLGGVVFDPSNRHSRPDVLNLWRGWAVTPQPGKWGLMQQHVRCIICRQSETLFNYVLDWMADVVQRPAKVSEVSVVMRGDEGSGKGILARALCRLFGKHGLHISNARHLVGNFNSHLADCVFLFADEAFFAGDKQHTGVLKALVSEPMLMIEAKYKNAVQWPNFVHLMQASNADWVVPASLRSRRWLMLDVSSERIGDHAYFAAIQAEMEAGGYAAMLHDLLNRDLSKSNLRAIPPTSALQDQRTQSLDTHFAWWLACLHRGYVFTSKLGLEDLLHVWPNDGFFSTELLYASYLAYCDRAHARYPLHLARFGEAFKIMSGGMPCRPKSGVVGEHMTEATTTSGSYERTSRVAELVTAADPRGYKLGTLGEARTAFAAASGLDPDWDEPPAPGGNPFAPGGTP
jgi:hypothetical protein